MTSAEDPQSSLLQLLDRQALTLRVARGTLWSGLEQALQVEGFTLGWGPPLQPDACVLSMLEQGGAGLASALYGAPLQNVVGLEARLSGSGSEGPLATTLSVPRSAAGPDFKHLLLGSGGRFGTLTAVTMRVYPLPRARCRLGWEARSLVEGLETLAEAVLLGTRPLLGLVYPLREGPASSAACLLELAGELEHVQALRAGVEARLRAGGKARAVTVSMQTPPPAGAGEDGMASAAQAAIPRVCTALEDVLGTRLRSERLQALHDPAYQVGGSWTQLRSALHGGSSLPPARLILAQGHERALLLVGSSPDAAKWRSHLRSAVVSTGSSPEAPESVTRRVTLNELLTMTQGGG